MDEFEYPRALYRDGGTELIWGKPVETLVVSSRGEEVEALAKGWRLHPLTDDEGEVLTVSEIESPRRGRPPKVRVEE
ncbi:hypothetical protein FPZ24_08185 [Sphingomonas panacisoli]|uniref:Uncharacterized protein n=1 Tax=Sphingomonas panacisoli TaxID=1813879 RepID=A0A5B8LHE8_9SPHN|nr:hypothetical protein [Sphingomonas panacisoli]QDZ07461.1 hypothetical protein FPZ24_08185 [Sphingomonas panacisoli]